MSDDAHRREERHREARDKTARQLRDLAQRAGRDITHTEARQRVDSAVNKNRNNER